MDDLRVRVGSALAVSVAAVREVSGGYTNALCTLCELSSGSSVFAKMATDDQTARWLETEYLLYSQVEADFLPTLIGWSPDERYPILILEDLSAALWPPPWTAGLIDELRRTLRDVASAATPNDLPDLEDERDALDGWRRVADDPGPFLSLGLCSGAWIERALPVLMQESARAVLTGKDLVHLDVRSDNVCFLSGRAKIIDWNNACRGNGAIDTAAWLPSLRLEGGPAPREVMRDSQGLSSLLSGYWASNAGLPAPAPALQRVRRIQLAQLQIALPWAIEEGGLSPLDGRRKAEA